MKDNFGRELSYLRLSVTDRCNLRCQYCMPEAGIEKHSHDSVLRNEEYIKLVKAMAELGITKVRFTGGEPLVRKGLPELIGEIKQIDGIKEVTLTTNGILLKPHLAALKKAGVNRLNISLDSLEPDTYRQLTRGGELSEVLSGIEEAIKLGFSPIKINVVLIKGVNDHEIDRMIHYFDPMVEVRFIELMPIGEAASWSKDKFIDLSHLFSTREGYEAEPNDGKSGPCRYFRQTKTGRRVGIINSISEHFCASCNRLRVTSDGMLKTCLHDTSEVNLRTVLADEVMLKQTILGAVGLKPESHHLGSENHLPISRNMYTIGG